MSNSDKIVRSTVRVENIVNGSVVSTGSGLMLLLKVDSFGTVAPVVVTNRHVVDGCDKIGYIVAGKNDGDKVNVIIEKSGIILHPDPNIDLAIISVPQEIFQSKSHRNVFVSSDDIYRNDRLENLTAIESVFMIGYPNGIIDTSDLYPIVRRGVTATPAFRKLDGLDRFMIDCACFPGSSGSPVFLYDSGVYSDRNNDVSLGSVRFGILGFLYAGPVMTGKGEVVAEPPPLNLARMVEVPLMMNLGFCVRAERVFDFIPQLLALKN